MAPDIVHKPQFSLLIQSLPVGIVKHNFLQDGEGSQLRQGPVEGGQLRATGVSSPGHKVVHRHHHGPRDEHVVEEDRLHCMAQLSGIHLDGGRFEQHLHSNSTETRVILPLRFLLLRNETQEGVGVVDKEEKWKGKNTKHTALNTHDVKNRSLPTTRRVNCIFHLHVNINTGTEVSK